mgnify:FL=1
MENKTHACHPFSLLKPVYFDMVCFIFTCLVGVQGYKNSHDCLYFNVLRSRWLHSILMEDEVVTQGNMFRVHIVEEQ